MTFIPCIATIAAIKQETGAWKWPVFTTGMLLIVSLGAATMVYQVARILGEGG